MSKFPLILELGLKVDNPFGLITWNVEQPFVLARDLERVLAAAPAVSCKKLGESGLTDEHGPGWVALELSTRISCYQHTHTARLICIQPIKPPDTAESLLRELVDCPKWEGPFTDLQERARKLLGEGK